jgi:hypothetical protein
LHHRSTDQKHSSTLRSTTQHRLHTKGKVDILNANGYVDVSAILAKETPVKEIKSKMADSYDLGLF